MSRDRCAASNLYVDLAILGAERDVHASTRVALEARVASCAFEGECSSRHGAGRWRLMMLDAVFLALGLGFFAAGCLYLHACDRL